LVTKCKSDLTLTNEKGEIVFELNQKRRSKLIKIFVEKAIREKWVLKRDLMFIMLSISQSDNIEDFVKLKEQIEKEEGAEQ
jgi:hypothetical protein